MLEIKWRTGGRESSWSKVEFKHVQCGGRRCYMVGVAGSRRVWVTYLRLESAYTEHAGSELQNMSYGFPCSRTFE